MNSRLKLRKKKDIVINVDIDSKLIV